MYLRFETADVHAHVELGLNVTPKVHLMWKHLMWKHVFEQMLLDGGLWHKREDWVERLHQVTSKIREQHRYAKDMRVRCVSMARMHQQKTDPRVVSWGAKVDEDACRGPRNNYTNKESERKKERDIRRVVVLDNWETEHPDKAYKKPQQDMVQE
mmetsp:Transcript_13741/g.22524  ORF Transcript_13741/g.22524 Transcript_13741/m.22524 type:complete len:154 (+) Transcript_13741:529-990(+)